MKRLFYYLVVMSIISISISSCKKENSDPEAQNSTAVDESVVISGIISDSFTDLISLSAENEALFSVSGSDFQIQDVPASTKTSCGEISLSPLNSTWPKTLTVDFGAGCTVDNVTRKGKIKAVFSDHFKNTGAKITVTFENFQVNDHKIEGTKIITNNGKNAAGRFNFNVEVSDAKITSSGKVISFSSENNIEWIEGAGTRTASDDWFSITGSANGTASNGQDVAITIVKPLIVKAGCRFIVAGSADIKAGSHPTSTLDYGQGECDNKATVTVSGETKEITLHK